MAKAPLPTSLTGDFFLLAYDRDTEDFTLFVDDRDHTSYNLGNDIQKIMRWFRMLGIKELGDRAIDVAHEFGAAQAIPSDGRVIPQPPMQQRCTRQGLFDEPSEKVFNLPQKF